MMMAVALARPNAHTFTEIVHALRTSYQSRGFPKSVCDCFDAIAKGLATLSPLRVVLAHELLSLFSSMAAYGNPASASHAELLVPICTGTASSQCW